MSLAEEIKDFEREFLAKKGWVKSDEELKMEGEGYKLVDSLICSKWLVLDYGEAEREFGKGEYTVRIGAYDHFACPHQGSSLYVRKEGLIIIPDRVVSRDKTTLTDRPYGNQVGGLIMEYARQHYLLTQERRSGRIQQLWREMKGLTCSAN